MSCRADPEWHLRSRRLQVVLTKWSNNRDRQEDRDTHTHPEIETLRLKALLLNQQVCSVTLCIEPKNSYTDTQGSWFFTPKNLLTTHSYNYIFARNLHWLVFNTMYRIDRRYMTWQRHATQFELIHCNRMVDTVTTSLLACLFSLFSLLFFLGVKNTAIIG